MEEFPPKERTHACPVGRTGGEGERTEVGALLVQLAQVPQPHGVVRGGRRQIETACANGRAEGEEEGVCEESKRQLTIDRGSVADSQRTRNILKQHYKTRDAEAHSWGQSTSVCVNMPRA